jgi:hypothetical protein
MLTLLPSPAKQSKRNLKGEKRKRRKIRKRTSIRRKMINRMKSLISKTKVMMKTSSWVLKVMVRKHYSKLLQKEIERRKDQSSKRKLTEKR